MASMKDSSIKRLHAAKAAQKHMSAPVRHHYLENELSALSTSAKHDDDGPPGPGPDTVLRSAGPMMSTSSVMAGGSSGQRPPMYGAAANQGAFGTSSVTAKQGPARVRANPVQIVPSHGSPLTATTSPHAASTGGRGTPTVGAGGRITPARPMSGKESSRNSTPTLLAPAANTNGSDAATKRTTTFDEELESIGKMHEKEVSGVRATGYARSTSSLEMQRSRSSASNAGAGGGNNMTSSSPLPPNIDISEYDIAENSTMMIQDGGEGGDQGGAGGGADANPDAPTATGKPIHVPYTPDLRAKLSAATTLHSHVPPKPMVLKDYVLLAEACQRAGRARMEGHAYYKIAETYAKKRESLTKAVQYFKRYLNISRRLNDLQGEAKALNCLGIVHMEMAQGNSSGNNNGQQQSVDSSSSTNTNALHIAMEYHKQHAEIADAAGIFIANTNMGLIFAKLANMSAAIECHKQALQYAVRAGDKAAESLALANLGQVGTKQGDFATARVCVERHLELSSTLHDNDACCEAYEQLGILALQRGDFSAACDHFLLALDVAIREGDQDKAKGLRCQVGYAQGMMRLENHMKETAQGMGNTDV